MKNKTNLGFTLVEILVIIGITAFLTMNLISSVLKSRISLAETVRIVVSDIRTAQANSLASKQYQGTHRCGYGLFLDLNSQNNYTNDRFILYVGRLPQANGCDANNWKFNTAQDTPIIYTRILDSKLEFWDPNGNTRPNTNDITFEPYNGHIRIDNMDPLIHSTNQNQNLSQIVIRKKGATCPSVNCAYICVYAFGRISVRSDQACPLCQGPSDNTPIACQQW